MYFARLWVNLSCEVQAMREGIGVEITLDISIMSAAEQRIFASLLPQLDADVDGKVKTSLGVSLNTYTYRLALRGAAYQVLSPEGAVRAQLMRPLVLGGLKRMMADLKKDATMVQQRSHAPRFSQTRSDVAFASNPNLGALLAALRAPGAGIFEIRFGDGGSIRIDRLAQNFRCKGFNRAELLKKLGSDSAVWGQIAQQSNASSDETQASLSPLLYFLGAVTAKDHFTLGVYQEQEFQIRQTVGFAKVAGHERIAQEFAEFAGVSDVALKTAVAPKEVLSCLNAYGALGLVRARERQAASVLGNKLDAAAGLLSKLKSKLGA
jgi:hypothetical protein